MRLFGLLLPLCGAGVVLGGCPSSEPVARLLCATDQDCRPDERCLVDLTLDEAYCARLCRTSADCETYQSCEGRLSDTGAGPEDLICVDQVRSCQSMELCNGLDDDCDEVIDNAGCQPIIGCTSDAPCAAFRCQAPSGQAETLCAPPNGAAPVANFEPCSGGSDCENNLCDHAQCSPVCDPIRPGLTCPEAHACVEGLAEPSAPPHNTCARTCGSPADCALPGTTCVWRRVALTPDVHGLVCSTPPPGRKPLGAACSGFGVGDDECESGLCFSCRCTRACAGDDACLDVRDGFRCVPRRLPYGALEYTFRVCSATVAVGSCGGGS